MKAHISFISSLHLTMSSCFGNHLMEIHMILQLGFLLHIHSLLKYSSHIFSSKRFNCRHHPVSYESYDICRFLGDKIFLTKKFSPRQGLNRGPLAPQSTAMTTKPRCPPKFFFKSWISDIRLQSVSLLVSQIFSLFTATRP